MRIARHFSAEVANCHGPDKLDAALQYMEALILADEQPGDLLAAEIRIRNAAQGDRVSDPVVASTANLLWRSAGRGR